MSNLNLQKLCELVWPWPWTFKRVSSLLAVTWCCTANGLRKLTMSS